MSSPETGAATAVAKSLFAQPQDRQSVTLSVSEVSLLAERRFFASLRMTIKGQCNSPAGAAMERSDRPGRFGKTCQVWAKAVIPQNLQPLSTIALQLCVTMGVCERGEGQMSLKLRRHYKLIVALVLFSAVLIVGAGDQPIIAYTIRDGGQAADQGTAATVATLGSASDDPALLEDMVVHSIQSLISIADH